MPPTPNQSPRIVNRYRRSLDGGGDLGRVDAMKHIGIRFTLLLIGVLLSLILFGGCALLDAFRDL
jgi:hypothetical protein